MELKRVVHVVTAAIALCAVASSASLVLITGYLHRITIQIDSNLQSVRAAEEIELQLLWHARSVNQANLLRAPDLSAVAAQAEMNVRRWLQTAYSYVGSEEERTLLENLQQELDHYFAKNVELAASGLPALQRYAEASAVFDDAYELAEELLQVNVSQASSATEQAATWDRFASVIGLSVPIAVLALTTLLIIGARSAVYRPLLTLGQAMNRFAAGDYATRAQERGAAETRAIAKAFNRMADELQRQREQQLTFVASVAHDLRNPLAAIKSSVEAIAASTHAREPKTLTAVVRRQIDVLVRMISDLLDSARIESGHLTLARADLDAADLIRDAVALFRTVAPLHELVIEVPSTPLRLRCDGARISQVINNLLSNAIKYSPQGGRIEVRAYARASGIEIAVSDQGLGISADDWATIFEPFKRARNPSWAIPGVGIGLSVARRIVEAHGGTISVQSVVGNGSTFSVRIPSDAAGATEESTRSSRFLPPRTNGAETHAPS